MEGVYVKLHSFLISTQDGCEWDNSNSGRCTTGNETMIYIDKRPGGLQNRSRRTGEGKIRTYTGNDDIDRSLYTSNV